VQQDANWNVTALVHTSGAVAERYEYDPYGTVSILAPNWTSLASSNFAWVYLHQGGRLDFATGLYQFRHRDYSPTLGRWMQQDPLGYRASGPNLYQYVNSRPTTSTDALGLWSVFSAASLLYVKNLSPMGDGLIPDLVNLGRLKEIGVPDRIPSQSGAPTGDLGGLNRAFNRMGLPGLGLPGGNESDGESSGDSTGPQGTSGGVCPDDEAGDSNEYHGRSDRPLEPEGLGPYDYFSTAWGLVTEPIKAVIEWLVGELIPKIVPDPMDDGTRGPGGVKTDGSGHVRPHGTESDNEVGGIGHPLDRGWRVSLADLAHFHQQTGGGSSSAPGVNRDAPTNPGNGDGQDNGPAGEMKAVVSTYDAVFDPAPFPMRLGAASTGVPPLRQRT
jgi:RHS repeat-associated protein